MDPLNLYSKPLGEQLSILSVRHDLLRRLWPEEDKIKALVEFSLIENCKKDRGFYFKQTDDFLAGVFSQIHRPSDLIDILSIFRVDKYQQVFLDKFVFSSVADGDVIAALVSDPVTFSKLPQTGGWIGHAIWRRAIILFQDHPNKRFEIEQLLPLGIEIDRTTARAILGTAFDEGQLSDAGIKCLLELFPSDQYFRNALNQKGSFSGSAGESEVF